MEQDSSMTNPLSSPLPPQNNPPPPSHNSPITSPTQTQTSSPSPQLDTILLETCKIIEMWESFIQRGIEHDLAQDLAHSNAIHNHKFEAESSKFHEKCLEMLQWLSISPLAMQNIHLIPKFLKHQRKR